MGYSLELRIYPQSLFAVLTMFRAEPASASSVLFWSADVLDKLHAKMERMTTASPSPSRINLLISNPFPGTWVTY